MKFSIAWRKEGSIVSRQVEGESPEGAYNAFVQTSPGGGLPVKPTFNQTDDITTSVMNAGGRSLAVIVRL